MSNNETDDAARVDRELTAFPSVSSHHEQMLNMIFGASLVQITRCAALFSLAEHIAAGPASALTIAHAEGLHPEATMRFLRACASFGLLLRREDGKFESTPLLQTLKKDDPRSLREFALMQAGPGHWKPWGQLDEAIRSGKRQDEATLGTPLFEYYTTPAGAAEGRALLKSMSGATAVVDAAAAKHIDVKQGREIVDVGGAGGSLLRAILNENPQTTGILYDLPNVIETAAALDENKRLADRLFLAAGSFFERVPRGDIFLLRHILHDWPDERALEILKSCRKAANPKLRLLIIEIVLDETVPSPFASRVDLTMLMALGGKERTQSEFGALLTAAGFDMMECKPLLPPYSIIEAVVA